MPSSLEWGPIVAIDSLNRCWPQFDNMQITQYWVEQNHLWPKNKNLVLSEMNNDPEESVHDHSSNPSPLLVRSDLISQKSIRQATCHQAATAGFRYMFSIRYGGRGRCTAVRKMSTCPRKSQLTMTTKGFYVWPSAKSGWLYIWYQINFVCVRVLGLLESAEILKIASWRDERLCLRSIRGSSNIVLGGKEVREKRIWICHLSTTSLESCHSSKVYMCCRFIGVRTRQ